MREIRRIAPERLKPRARINQPRRRKLTTTFRAQLTYKGYSAEQVEEIVGTLREAEEQSRHADGRAGSADTPEIGARMEDGTIYAGISPETGREMFTTPGDDTPLQMQWTKALAYADGLDAYGHQDWRLPTRAELDVLYRNRESGMLRETFGEGWYWSSTECYVGSAWIQRFSDGNQSSYGKYGLNLVRCVRR